MKTKTSKNKRISNPFEGVGFLFGVCWQYDPWYIVLLVSREIITSAAALVSVMLPGQILNSIFVYGDLSKGLVYLALLLGVALFSGALQTVFSSLSMVARAVVYKQFQLDLSRRIMNIRFERTETAEFLDLKARAERFISSGGQGFGGILEQAFGIGGTVITIVGYAWILSKVDFLLTAMVLALTGLSIWLNYHLSQKNIEINLEKASQERRAAYFSQLTQHYKYGKEIRSNGCSNWISERYEGQLNILQRFYERLSRYGIKYGCLILLTSIVQRAVTYLYLIDTVVKGGILVGDFSVYLSAMESLSGGLKGLVGGVASLYQFDKYYDAFKEYYRISEQDALAEIQSVPMPALDRELTIAFHDVSFRYPDAEHNALSHVSCEIRKGDVVSIVGDNGAGKSTFIKLLLRLYEPSEGTISINGQDISTFSRAEYARHFACVFQDYQLLSFTLRDNVALGAADGQADEGRLDEALSFVSLTDRVAMLPKGKDTMIYRDFDKEGFTPSGGEAQRLAVARAVYRSSEVLILDEPTASLDPNIEYELNQQIRSRLYGKKTIINVSHRLHSVRSSNKIFVFRDGRLIESGTHSELFSKESVYRQMFSRQASDYMDIPGHDTREISEQSESIP